MSYNITVRSKAPLRLGLAGGGTDVSPYSDQFGGCVLNATIDLYAHCTIELLEEKGNVEFVAKDIDQLSKFPLAPKYSVDGKLLLHKAVYNRVVHDFTAGRPLSVRVTTFSDALPGSGLGSSSTMVVAMLAAYRELLDLPLGEYDIAHLAFEIERKDCQLAGGKQDQYAATFGGFNFMEFYGDDKVIVNPLRIRRHVENELQANLMLYFTGVSRSSAEIIDDQIRTVQSADTHASSVAAMHDMKRLAIDMKEAILKGDIEAVTELFRRSWEAKKLMSGKISNSGIDAIADGVMSAGARAVKIAGAGGGGFMMIFADPTARIDVERSLCHLPGHWTKFHFTQSGVESWKLKC
jgi:D-glycero-alpha-D-manno-heptose-7-phosphate kinase